MYDEMKRLALSVFFMVLAFMTPDAAWATPKCEADTFTGKKACAYGIGTIGLAGVGNQILTVDGQMIYQKYMMETNRDPLNAEAILFRVDDRRTIRLVAKNASQPTVSCTTVYLCTWSWNVIAPISSDVLTELAQAKKLIIAIEGENHRRTGEMTMKKGGAIFLKFLKDIQVNEPSVLASSKAEAFIQIGDSVIPYVAPTKQGDVP